jgi:hypothetical protein
MLFQDPHRIGPGYQPPDRRGQAEPPPVMTVAGAAAEAAPAPQLPKAETPAQLAFQAYELAVDAQHDLNRQADAEYNGGHGALTEAGLRERRAEIQNSREAKLVDMGEHAVLQRRAEADQHYADLIAAKILKGDAAQEERNTRYAKRVERELEAAKSPGERVAVAQRMLEQADGPQLGVLCEELPSLFPGAGAAWLPGKLREVDAELAAAAEDVRRASQVAAMSKVAAGWVRNGFQTGVPPSQVSNLAGAVSKYDPDCRGG